MLAHHRGEALSGRDAMRHDEDEPVQSRSAESAAEEHVT
jgi:hypothetical protein